MFVCVSVSMAQLPEVCVCMCVSWCDACAHTHHVCMQLQLSVVCQSVSMHMNKHVWYMNMLVFGL